MVGMQVLIPYGIEEENKEPWVTPLSLLNFFFIAKQQLCTHTTGGNKSSGSKWQQHWQGHSDRRSKLDENK